MPPAVERLPAATSTPDAADVEFSARPGYLAAVSGSPPYPLPLSTVPLEDELGDVLEKAMTCSGLNAYALAQRSGVAEGRILDAVDYRSELDAAECCRLARALGLNEVGLCALASGKYPLPEPDGLPFPLWPLRVPYGIGVLNSYLVGAGGAGTVLFDTGPALGPHTVVWPAAAPACTAVFITHVDLEHVGGMREILQRFGTAQAFVPEGETTAGTQPLAEGDTLRFGGLEIAVFRTPGHCAKHNCYQVRVPGVPAARSLLITGDLVFAGSAGGPYHCQAQLRRHLRRVLEAVPPDTVVAPGHGPLTTAGNELRYNPFAA